MAERALPRSFWMISGLLLIWQLIGCAAYLNEMTLDMSEVEPELRAIYDAVPMWAASAFAIAVWAGLLAAIALLLRRKVAVILYIVSFIAIVVQNIHWFFLSGTFEVLGYQFAIMPAVVLLIGIFAIWYSNRAAAKGWLR